MCNSSNSDRVEMPLISKLQSPAASSCLFSSRRDLSLGGQTDDVTVYLQVLWWLKH